MAITIPAQYIGPYFRPELHIDDTNHLVLDAAGQAAADAYGLRFLYIGLPASTLYPPVYDSVSTPVDTNAGANTVVEGAAANTLVGITANATSSAGQPITYSLTNSANGAFKINATTGVVSVNDSTKVDFETAPGHAYTITVQANDGIITTSQTFTIGVSDIAPMIPTDGNANTNAIAEGAAVNTLVGITATSTDINGPGVTWTLTDNAGGAFKIDPVTGVVSVADSTKIDYETAPGPGHTYNITARASDGTLSSSQTFTIAVTDVSIPAPSDTNAAANTVVENAAVGTAVGITASALDPNGPATTYSLIGDTSLGGFGVNSATGIVTVIDPSKIDFESAAGHAYTVTVQATNGATTTSTPFTIAVTDVAPATPTDINGAANSVFEGAANGTLVGLTVTSSDINGGALTYTLVGDTSGGGFAIDLTTGVVSVADTTKIDFESAPGHAYTVTARASDGTLGTTQTFTIGVADVNDAPAGTDKTVSTPEDNSYTFSVSDFGFNDLGDASPNSLLAVKITTVPGAGAGTLTNNGVTVNAGDFVTATNIAAGLLIFTPVPDANGSPEATFTFQVQDNGGTANGGVDLDQSANTLSINVIAANDAPVNTVPGGQTVAEDTTLPIAGVSVADIDSSALTTTLSVAHGTLTVTAGAGVTGNGTASVNITGTSAQINAALAGLAYTGNLDFNGADTLTVATNDGIATDTDTIAINVTAANDAPVNTVPGGQTLNEDTTLPIAGVSVADIDSSALTTTLSVASGTLSVSVLPGVTGNGTASVNITGTAAQINAALAGLAYTGNLDFNGGDTLTVATSDGTDTGTDTIAITVNAVNDAPAGTDTTVSSNGAHTFTAADFGFTDPTDAAFAAGANNLLAVKITTLPTSGTLTNNGGAVSAGDFIPVADITGGHLLFTPTGGANASLTFQVQDDGGTANFGVDLDQSANTLTINQNLPPAITSDGGGAVAATSVAENTSAVTVVVANDPDAGPSPITYSIVPGDDGAKFSIVASGVGAGTLTFITAPDFENPTDLGDTAGNNTYVVTVRASDGASFDDQTITVTVTNVNDAPTITTNGGGATASINVDENTTAVTTVQASDQDVPAQTFTYSLAGGADQGKFSIDPVSGVLTLNTAPNFEVPTDIGGDNGYDVIVRATDNGAPTQHDDQAITVHVQNVNEAPDTGAITTSGNEDPTGPAYIPITITGSDVDAGDTIASYHITNLPTGAQGVLYSDTGLTTPVVSGNDYAATGGTLTLYFKPVANFNGPVTFQAAATDNHGVTDATPATETINVTAVNDAPTAAVPTDASIGTAFSHTDLAISGLSVADVDAAEPGGGDITATISSLHAGLSFTTAGLASFTNNGTHTVTLTGTAAQVNAALSTLIYNSDDGFVGSDTVTLNVSDNGHTGSGGVLTSGNQTFHVGVVPQVFIIDNTPVGAGNDGSLANPFNSIASFNSLAADGSGDYIYINAGTYSEADGINLLANEHLFGQGQSLTFTNPVTGEVVTIGTGSGASTPTISVTGANQHGIDLGSGNEVTGLNVATTLASQTGIFDSGASVGSLSMNDIDVTGSGQAVNITHGGALTRHHRHASSQRQSSFGVQLWRRSDRQHHRHDRYTFRPHHVGQFDVNGGTGNITYGGAIGNGTGQSISVASHTGGTVAFSGAITDTNDAGGGVSLTGNTGATINFTGGMTLDTGASNGFVATGGGTVNVTGTNHLTTTTGTALNISNTTIGASNVTFQDISSNGGTAAGIILINTGTNGGLIVTGLDGADAGALPDAGSGGTIANKSGANIWTSAGGVPTLNGTTVGVGVYLSNTSFTQLNGMQLNDFSNTAISAFGSSNLTLNDSVISGSNGDDTAIDEASLFFYNTTGTADMNRDTVGGGVEDNLHILNTSGTLNRFTVDSSTFNQNNSTTGNNNITVESQNAGTTLNFTLQNSTIKGARADWINASNNSSSTMDVVIKNNSFDNLGAEHNAGSAAGGNRVVLGAVGTMTFDIDGNTLVGSLGEAIRVRSTAVGTTTGNATGYVRNNTIGDAAIANSGSSEGSGIFVFGDGGSDMTIVVDNNHVFQYNNSGIRLLFGDEINDGSLFNATVTNNVVNTPGTINNGFNGLLVTSGSVGATDNFTVRLDISDNDLRGGGRVVIPDAGAVPNDDDLRLNQRFATHVELPGYTGSSQDTAAVVAYLLGRGNLVDGASDISAQSNAAGGYFNTPGGAPPALPPFPLLAAAGGVQASSPTPGETHLTQAQLDSVVAAAIAQWAQAGASAAQLAALSAITFTVADLNGSIAGEQTPGHIVIDADAAGHGWFIDPTPSDNSEFIHAANAAGTDLFTDPTNAAAGHLDLLTTVVHEMGHELGLPDLTAASDVNDLMYIDLVDGERRLPTTADVAQADGSDIFSFAAVDPPVPPAAPVNTPVAANAPGGGTLVGTTGADTFVFANIDVHAATAPPVAHVTNYNFAEGDHFDFSALSVQFHGWGVDDASLVRAVEDPSGHFATLQVNTSNDTSTAQAHWVSIAQVDGAHVSDHVGVLIDSNNAVHHVELMI